MTRVLVVEAEAHLRHALRDWIEAEGAIALEAASAEGALDLVEARGAPAVASCDIRLPGRDGIWLAEQFRILHPQTAVMMTTAQHDLDLAVRGLHAGVVDYLVKPFTRERMVEALQRAVLAHNARRTLAEMQQELEGWRAQVTEVQAQLESSTSSSLEALLATRRPHDQDALDRARRIALVAVNLALALQLVEPHLSDIERAVLLQDPVHPPTPDELTSLAILKGAPLLARATRIALAAHERYDGSGILHGRRGEEIPLGGRIIAVAAAYDGLVSGIDRVAPAEAVEMLSRQPALGFDPKVVEALRMLQPSITLPSSIPAGRDVLDRASPGNKPGFAISDPRRTWARKNLAQSLPARLGEHAATVIEVGYGGFRLEMPASLDASSPAPIVLDIPEYGVHTKAHCVWVRPLGTSGRYCCGAEVTSEETREGSRWRALVNALPEAPADPIRNP
jgi:cyclic di-GMP phosphodiesterase